MLCVHNANIIHSDRNHQPTHSSSQQASSSKIIVVHHGNRQSIINMIHYVPNHRRPMSPITIIVHRDHIHLPQPTSLTIINNHHGHYDKSAWYTMITKQSPTIMNTAKSLPYCIHRDLHQLTTMLDITHNINKYHRNPSCGSSIAVFGNHHANHQHPP